MALNAGALDNSGVDVQGTTTNIGTYAPPGDPNVAVAAPGFPPPPTSTASAPGPAAPPDAPPGSVTTDAGYTPDTGALIQADPTYQAWKQAADQQEASARAQRQAALRSAVIQYGGLPDGFNDQYGDIDQATLDAAKGNQHSTIANLHSNYDQSRRQFLSQLAARGALQSGDLNYGSDQLDRGLSQQEYDSANQFGQGAVGAENAYTGVLGQIAQGRVNAIQGAESNVASNPGYAPRAAKTAAYDAASSAKYGRPVYKDAEGNTFDIDGNALDLGGTNNSSPPPPMNPDGTSDPVTQLPYTPGATDANGLPVSAGYGGFDPYGNWTG